MKKFCFEEHLKGKYEKNVWWWPTKWYIEPHALGLYDWKEADEYFKSNYPVQYLLRHEIAYSYNVRISMRLRDLKYKIKNTLRNPRKEMRDSVFPSDWSDLTESITKFHTEAVIEFVDREKCFETVDYSSDEIHKKFQTELLEMHKYAKTKRPELLEQLDKAYERVDTTKPYHEAYKEVHEIENEIKIRDTKLCHWVIDNRDFFWV
jgi:hypothetical protein